MQRTLATILVGAAACGAHAQTATLTITADGASTATVAPGTPVHVALVVTYTSALQVGYVRGDMRVDADAGTGSNFVFHLGAGPFIHTGAFQGGSRVGIDAESGQPLFFGVNPLWSNQPLQMFGYDLTLHTPGTYRVAWEPPAGESGVGLYLFGNALYQRPAQTFYESATITVTPTPGAPLAVGALGLFWTRRRR